MRTPTATKALMAAFAALADGATTRRVGGGVVGRRGAAARDSPAAGPDPGAAHGDRGSRRVRSPARRAADPGAEEPRHTPSAESGSSKGEPAAPRASAPPSAPAAAPPPPPSARAEASASEGARAGAAAQRPPEPSVEPALGTIRGKLTVPAGEPVAYVYVENVLAPAVKGQRKVIEQAGKKFVPNWAVVQRGTSIAFPNMDNIYHNVFSLSSGNSFDLGLYNSGGEAKTHTFTEPGAVDVYCNIHPQMAASVLVVPNKHFAKVKGDGTFEIAGVPDGAAQGRRLGAWIAHHGRLGRGRRPGRPST